MQYWAGNWEKWIAIIEYLCTVMKLQDNWWCFLTWFLIEILGRDVNLLLEQTWRFTRKVKDVLVKWQVIHYGRSIHFKVWGKLYRFAYKASHFVLCGYFWPVELMQQRTRKNSVVFSKYHELNLGSCNPKNQTKEINIGCFWSKHFFSYLLVVVCVASLYQYSLLVQSVTILLLMT